MSIGGTVPLPNDEIISLHENYNLTTYTSFSTTHYTQEFVPGFTYTINGLALPIKTYARYRSRPVTVSDTLENPDGPVHTIIPFGGIHCGNLLDPYTIAVEPGVEYVLSDVITPFLSYRFNIPAGSAAESGAVTVHSVTTGARFRLYNHKQPVSDMNRYGTRFSIFIQPAYTALLEKNVPYIFKILVGIPVFKRVTLLADFNMVRLYPSDSNSSSAVFMGKNANPSETNSGLLFLELSPGGRPPGTGWEYASGPRYSLDLTVSFNY